MPTFKHRVHVIAHVKLDPEGRFDPQIDRVNISSNNAGSSVITPGREIFFDVFSSEGDSFEDARDACVRLLHTHPAYEWAYKLFLRPR